MLSTSLGFALIVLGYTGAVDLGFVAGSNVEAKLSNASPGLVLAFFGLAALWIAAVSFEVKTTTFAKPFAGSQSTRQVDLNMLRQTVFRNQVARPSDTLSGDSKQG
jgi:hypothetical protein